MPNPFSCHLLEITEFPEYEDLFVFDECDTDDFITKVLNPNGDPLLLKIESCYAPVVKFLEKSKG